MTKRVDCIAASKHARGRFNLRPGLPVFTLMTSSLSLLVALKCFLLGLNTLPDLKKKESRQKVYVYLLSLVIPRKPRSVCFFVPTEFNVFGLMNRNIQPTDSFVFLSMYVLL